MSELNIKDTLIATRQLIAAPAKWMQRGFTNEKQCYCLVGAVMAAQGKAFGAGEFDPIVLFLAKTLDMEDALYPDVALFDWNDDHRRTHAEVLQLLDTAIAAQNA